MPVAAAPVADKPRRPRDNDPEAGLAARRYLLHTPAVAVRIAEEDEPDVVKGVPGGARVFAQDLNLANLHPSLDELCTRLVDV